MKLNNLCLVGLLFLLALSLSAAGEKKERKVVLYGRLGDSFTKVGVPGTFVTLMNPDSTIVDTMRIDTFSWRTYKQESYYHFNVPANPRRFIIRAQHPDYKDSYIDYELKNVARNTSFEIPMLPMHRKDKKADYSAMLGEVVVRATKIKMVYKGDTLVYNADAFNLPQGSMLDDLIKQLPGAQLKDNGEITINGRKVDYLMLNGKDFFKGNNKMMLENLPYYSVKNIQVYNKTTEKSKYLGQDAEKKDYVMDVTLKREYSKGYIANAEVAKGTDDRYMSRLFGLRFTDNSRISLFSNMNNVNETRTPGSEGDWEPSNSPQGRQSVKNIGVDVYIDDKDKRYTESFSSQMSWTGMEDENRTASETYLKSEKTYSRSHSMSNSNDYSFSANNEFQLLKPFYIQSSTSLSYNKSNRTSSDYNATFSGNPSVFGGTEEILDSLYRKIVTTSLKNITVNRTRSDAMSDSRNLTLEQRVSLTKKFSWGDNILLGANMRYNDGHSHDYSLYRLDYLQSSKASDFRNNYSSKTNKSYDYSLYGYYTVHLLWRLNFQLGYTYGQKWNNDDNPLYRLDYLPGWGSDDSRLLGVLPSDSLDMCLDQSNSSQQSSLVRTNTGSLKIYYSEEADSNYTYLGIDIPVTYKNEYDHYMRRSIVDTAFNQRNWLFVPSVQFYRWARNGRSSFYCNYSLNESTPSAVDLVNVRNDSNPLSIRLGNPNLKNSITHYFYGGFNLNKPSHEQFFSGNINVQLTQNDITNGYTYNSVKGVYTYRPENVNGNWNASSSINFGRALDKKKHFSFETITSGNYNHIVYLASENGQDQTSPCKMNSYGLQERVSFKYQLTDLTLSLKSRFGWRHTGSATTTGTGTDIYDYDYGFIGQYKFPWKLQFATDITMFSRRGMSDSSMNTNDLVWNTSLSRAFLNGKLVCKLEAFDILHQLSQVSYNVSAGSMYSTWNNSIPRYIMLHLSYKINITPKKK